MCRRRTGSEARQCKLNVHDSFIHSFIHSFWLWLTNDWCYWQVVNVLYQENDWVYVIAEDQREGFIPHSYCAPYTPHLGEMTLTVKKKLPRDLGIPEGGDTNHNTTLNSTSIIYLGLFGELFNWVLNCWIAFSRVVFSSWNAGYRRIR